MRLKMLSKQSEMLNTEVSKFIANLTADNANFDDAIKAHRGWKQSCLTILQNLTVQ